MMDKKGKIKKIGEKVFDLVCGMELDPDRVGHTLEYRGQIYYFCSKNCKNNFEQNPEKYTAD